MVSIAGCGGDGEGEETSPELRALAQVSQLADLTGRMLVIAETVVEDPRKATREAASAELTELEETAEALADETAAPELDRELADQLAKAGGCLARGFASLGQAVSSRRGEEAQLAAEDAGSAARRCLRRLASATDGLVAATGADAEALAARIAGAEQEIDDLVAGLVTALAAPVPPEPVTAPETEPVEPDPATAPPEDLPPAEPGGFELSDLPECSQAPPPCRSGEDVVEP